MIKDRIDNLRKLMRENNIDIYYIPTADFHESEYVGEYFKARKFISGFTGSAGVCIVTLEKAGLWTDGRYFIQAERQLEGSTIDLYKMGVEGTISPIEFISENIKKDGIVGFDGRVVNAKFYKMLTEKLILSGKNVNFKIDKDLVDKLWKDRPDLFDKNSKDSVFLLEEKYSGKSTADKLKDVRAVMKKEKADIHVITTLDDIAWLFNIRGNDISHFPVVLAFAIIEMDKATLFVRDDCLQPDAVSYLEKSGVQIMDYKKIYEQIEKISDKLTVLLDETKVNTKIYKLLGDNTIINKTNPTVLMKSIKNKTELENLKNAHIKDGVAVTKFIYWLKSNIGKMDITELSVAEYLEDRRREQDGFLDISFDTIAAYKSNAAMMHYSASEKSNAKLDTEGMLLVDSGGHYLEGSTDITRTIVLGEISDEIKLHFTTVLRSMLNLADAKFLYGCTGVNLDILSRGPLWELGLDYRCGTGHGVGYLLNIHEPPNGFRWKITSQRDDSAVLEAGMVTTDEPGVYVEGSHGIRTENELVCKKAECNEYGQFMEFETITYAPIDIDGIDTKYMSEREIELLNRYHENVYNVISPYLTAAEAKWLKKYTKKL